MICRICNRDLEIPEDAKLLQKRFGISFFQFPDRSVHEFSTGKHNKKPQPQPKPEPPEPKYIVLPPKHKQVPAAKFPVTVPAIKVPVKVTPKQEEVPEYGDSNWSHPTGKTSMARAFERTKAKMETKQ